MVIVLLKMDLLLEVILLFQNGVIIEENSIVGAGKFIK